ncbi:hypothetical protein POP12_176 [Pectobacterium phage POP12]|nr:hypothetical protein POP12_176 [Pectobacterium phage POP12]
MALNFYIDGEKFVKCSNAKFTSIATSQNVKVMSSYDPWMKEEVTSVYFEDKLIAERSQINETKEDRLYVYTDCFVCQHFNKIKVNL